MHAKSGFYLRKLKETEKMLRRQLISFVINQFIYFLIGKENHILKRGEPQTGTPQEYTKGPNTTQKEN